MRRLIVWIVLGLVLVGSLRAQSTGADVRSPDKPFHIGLAATLIPMATGAALLATGNGTLQAAGGALLTGGALLGPSIGDWSGGMTGRGFLGFGLRTAAVVGGFYGAAGLCYTSCDGGEYATAIAVGIAGAALFVGTTVWELGTMKGATRRHQARRVALMPTYVPSTRAPGMAVRVSF